MFIQYLFGSKASHPPLWPAYLVFIWKKNTLTFFRNGRVNVSIRKMNYIAFFLAAVPITPFCIFKCIFFIMANFLKVLWWVLGSTLASSLKNSPLCIQGTLSDLTPSLFTKFSQTLKSPHPPILLCFDWNTLLSFLSAEVKHFVYIYVQATVLGGIGRHQ